jgi:hypothetical protein
MSDATPQLQRPAARGTHRSAAGAPRTLLRRAPAVTGASAACDDTPAMLAARKQRKGALRGLVLDRHNFLPLTARAPAPKGVLPLRAAPAHACGRRHGPAGGAGNRQGACDSPSLALAVQPLHRAGGGCCVAARARAAAERA